MRFILLLAALLLPTRAALAAPQIFPSSAGELKVETVAGGLVHPWSLAFLPDGRMLVSERPGRMRIVTRGGQLSPPLAGVPKVFAQSQAGLMDVMLGATILQKTARSISATPSRPRAAAAASRSRTDSWRKTAARRAWWR